VNAGFEPLASAAAPVPASARARTASGAKLLLGLVGRGIQRSLTPALHEEEARAQGLRLHYQLIDLDADTRSGGPAGLPTLLDAARTMGFAGLNITYPNKQAVIPLLDGLSDEARDMGAVNTVVFKNGQATGYNTDGSGWRWGMAQQLPGANLTRVVLLGAGGAGSAIAHALLRMGAQQLVLVDSDGARAATLAERLNQQYSPQHSGARAQASTDVAAALHSATGLVHATPTGMDKLPGLPLPAALLRPGLWVSDIVYFPLQTALLQAAREAGCAVADGAGMAVGQAVDAFRLFTGLEPNTARMRAHMQRLLQPTA
jgi:shikimate dehydrogenase